VRNEVHEASARAEGVAIVRRISGGGTMFAEPERTITYSLYLPEALAAGVSIAQSYALCDGWVVEALREAGIDCWYAPLNDIACAEGKIAGAAQARRAHAVLHHTTMAYAMEAEDMHRFLRTGLERISEKGVASANKRVSPLNRHTTLSRAEVVTHLSQAFQKRFGFRVDTLTAQERAAAAQLVTEKYATDQWKYALP
jgi:lipoate-protein ligase A